MRSCVVLVLLAASCVVAQNDAAARARKILSDDRYQTSLDARRSSAEEDSGRSEDRDARRGDRGGSGSSGERRGRSPSGRTRRSEPPAQMDPAIPAFLSRAILVVIVVVLLAILVRALVDARRGGRRPPVSIRSEPIPAPRAVEVPPMDEIDAATAEGRYDEAVHMMLLRAVARLSEDRTIGDALTSREILRAVVPGGAAHDAFNLLVTTVEASVFGGRPVDEEEAGRCRQAYDSLDFREAAA